MFNSKERKEARLNCFEGIEVSDSKYNLYLGLMICYGLIMNVLSIVFCKDFFLSINPILFLVFYFISCFSGSIISFKSSSPIVSFLGYNLIVVPIGGLLTIALVNYKGADILAALIVTSLIVFVMIFLGMIFPNIFRNMGWALFLGLFLGLLGEIIASLFGYGGNLFNWIFVIIFSMYVSYDFVKAQDYPKTFDNAIDSAIDIYLDIINLFIRLLNLLRRD